MNRFILGNGIFDRASNKLLNLPCCCTRPRTKCYRDPDRNVGVFPLRHAVVAKPTPYQDTDEQHPRDLWMLHEESRYVTGFLDSILVAFVCHELVCLRNHLDGVA